MPAPSRRHAMIDDALRAAVTLARNDAIRSVDALRSRLSGLGFTNDEIKGAILTWSRYVQETRAHDR
ncbi:hypothetical protein [Caulobacter phage Cr30]|uniref:hypothetical protein n=1 Tax=Caulobacter phage Cr30 TaxID=1357714 RepID=UPI0004A9BAC1|nr:hypothetical protein OZ74_gp019 [Caulobacter phage Cr30]AGS80904.1 hypothetical protein [Caulobacter phage Cr30]